MLSVDVEESDSSVGSHAAGFAAQEGAGADHDPRLHAPRGFCSVDELVSAIDDYIDCHNDSPKPFIWTAKASEILEKIRRARLTLNKRHSD